MTVELQSLRFGERVLAGPIEKTVRKTRSLFLDVVYDLLAMLSVTNGSSLSKLFKLFFDVDRVDQVKNLLDQAVGEKIVGEGCDKVDSGLIETKGPADTFPSLYESA